MAITTVKGSVTRTFYNGKGAEITESFMLQGKEWKKRWSAWFEQPHGLNEGQEVEVSGLHGDEIDEWEKDGETRRAVKRSLNKARVADSTPTASHPEPVRGVTDQGGDWAGSEVPF